MTKVKRLRTVLTVGVLVAGLVFLGWAKTRGVDATDCDTAFQNYINADNTYENARYSYFYGSPTTCDQECSTDPNPPQCVIDCQIRRYTELGNAELGMSTAAEDTCTPYTLDGCAQARARADNCFAQYDPSAYSDPEEAAAVAAQRWACREASKVDYCQ